MASGFDLFREQARVNTTGYRTCFQAIATMSSPEPDKSFVNRIILQRCSA